ncbi:hypothetical protein B0H11DRAFT_1964134 [Mycena galericulata]|nr:hypothetical protein B0H11DRAFT_1964134 [Mycena galericulata]
MPAPALVGVYVLAAVGTVAAGVAFKEFIYEPHIAPRVERWAEEFLAKRRARKQARAGKTAIPVPSATNKRSDDGHDDAGDVDAQSTYELESLVANEVRQWRSQVDVGGSQLRQRKTGTSTESALDESNIIIPYSPMTPTHVLFDPTDGLSVSSPTSTISSRVPTPSPHSTLSHSTFRTPPPPAVRAPPTPEPSAHGSPARTPAAAPAPIEDPFTSPHHVPSLSLSHPLDLDSEADLELLSAPASETASSRPTSPFSDVSHSHAGTGHEQFYSFASSATTGTVRSPEIGTLSDLGDEWSTAGSEILGSESSWASAGGHSG